MIILITVDATTSMRKSMTTRMNAAAIMHTAMNMNKDVAVDTITIMTTEAIMPMVVAAGMTMGMITVNAAMITATDMTMSTDMTTADVAADAVKKLKSRMTIPMIRNWLSMRRMKKTSCVHMKKSKKKNEKRSATFIIRAMKMTAICAGRNSPTAGAIFWQKGTSVPIFTWNISTAATALPRSKASFGKCLHLLLQPSVSRTRNSISFPVPIRKFFFLNCSKWSIP